LVNRSLPAVAAAAATVETAPLEAAREGVPGSGSLTAGAAPREATEAGLAEGGSEASQSRNRLTGFGSGLIGDRGLRPLALLLLAGLLQNHWRSRGGLSGVAVDQCEGHPGLRSGGAVDSAPGGEGRKGLLEAASLLAGQQVTSRDDHAVRSGTEPPLDKLVEAGEIRHHFQSGVQNEEVHAVGAVAAAWLREVAWARGDDNHSSVAAGEDDPLQVCHSGSQRDLVDDDNFANNLEIAILQFVVGRNLAVGIGAAETHIIKSIYHNRSVSRKAGAEVIHLRKDAGDRVGGKGPPAGGDGLRDDAESGSRLAGLSALLMPMNRAAVSSIAGAEPAGKIKASLERLGRVSKFNL
jgi:hypothetical protein